MYLIVGANGYLGSYIIKNVLEMTNEKIIATARTLPEEKRNRVKWTECDVTDRKSVENLNQLISTCDPCKVIYLAAYHHPDKVEKDSKVAWNVNITALAFFLNQLENIESLFYTSTDSVYGEGSLITFFREDDQLIPVNKYGEQKKLAEQLVMTYGYNVVRYPFLIGPSLIKKKHFYDVIVEAITNGEIMDMFEDSYRSSLDFNSAANLLVQLMECRNYKKATAYNISGDESLSKYDIGLRIAERYNVSKKFIHGISSMSKNDIFIAKRANISLLDNSELKRVLGINNIKIDI